eukprot:GHRR01000462.1.p1 GENE.GHRR01000462.1~~GHRR01000462.1.p1  ORF type:complete len:2238 (+),score=1076.63 GHRR01000462.1:245-6958(+)
MAILLPSGGTANPVAVQTCRNRSVSPPPRFFSGAFRSGATRSPSRRSWASTNDWASSNLHSSSRGRAASPLKAVAVPLQDEISATDGEFRLDIVKVQFKVPHYATSFGQELKIVGGAPELGEWDVTQAPAMTWNEGHSWTLTMFLPPGTYPFKVVVASPGGPAVARWETGDNRSVTIAADSPELGTAALVFVDCIFDQTTSTQTKTKRVTGIGFRNTSIKGNPHQSVNAEGPGLSMAAAAAAATAGIPTSKVTANASQHPAATAAGAAAGILPLPVAEPLTQSPLAAAAIGAAAGAAADPGLTPDLLVPGIDTAAVITACYASYSSMDSSSNGTSTAPMLGSIEPAAAAGGVGAAPGSAAFASRMAAIDSQLAQLLAAGRQHNGNDASSRNGASQTNGFTAVIEPIAGTVMAAADAVPVEAVAATAVAPDNKASIPAAAAAAHKAAGGFPPANLVAARRVVTDFIKGHLEVVEGQAAAMLQQNEMLEKRMAALEQHVQDYDNSVLGALGQSLPQKQSAPQQQSMEAEHTGTATAEGYTTRSSTSVTAAAAQFNNQQLQPKQPPLASPTDAADLVRRFMTTYTAKGSSSTGSSTKSITTATTAISGSSRSSGISAGASSISNSASSVFPGKVTGVSGTYSRWSIVSGPTIGIVDAASGSCDEDDNSSRSTLLQRSTQDEGIAGADADEIEEQDVLATVPEASAAFKITDAIVHERQQQYATATAMLTASVPAAEESSYLPVVIPTATSTMSADVTYMDLTAAGLSWTETANKLSAEFNKSDAADTCINASGVAQTEAAPQQQLRQWPSSTPADPHKSAEAAAQTALAASMAGSLASQPPQPSLQSYLDTSSNGGSSSRLQAQQSQDPQWRAAHARALQWASTQDPEPDYLNNSEEDSDIEPEDIPWWLQDFNLPTTKSPKPLGGGSTGSPVALPVSGGPYHHLKWSRGRVQAPTFAATAEASADRQQQVDLLECSQNPLLYRAGRGVDWDSGLDDSFNSDLNDLAADLRSVGPHQQGPKVPFNGSGVTLAIATPATAAAAAAAAAASPAVYDMQQAAYKVAKAKGLSDQAAAIAATAAAARVAFCHPDPTGTTRALSSSSKSSNGATSKGPQQPRGPAATVAAAVKTRQQVLAVADVAARLTAAADRMGTVDSSSPASFGARPEQLVRQGHQNTLSVTLPSAEDFVHAVPAAAAAPALATATVPFTETTDFDMFLGSTADSIPELTLQSTAVSLAVNVGIADDELAISDVTSDITHVASFTNGLADADLALADVSNLTTGVDDSNDDTEASDDELQQLAALQQENQLLSQLAGLYNADAAPDASDADSIGGVLGLALLKQQQQQGIAANSENAAAIRTLVEAMQMRMQATTALQEAAAEQHEVPEPEYIAQMEAEDALDQGAVVLQQLNDVIDQLSFSGVDIEDENVMLDSDTLGSQGDIVGSVEDSYTSDHDDSDDDDDMDGHAVTNSRGSGGGSGGRGSIGQDGSSNGSSSSSNSWSSAAASSINHTNGSDPAASAAAITAIATASPSTSAADSTAGAPSLLLSSVQLPPSFSKRIFSRATASETFSSSDSDSACSTRPQPVPSPVVSPTDSASGAGGPFVLPPVVSSASSGAVATAAFDLVALDNEPSSTVSGAATAGTTAAAAPCMVFRRWSLEAIATATAVAGALVSGADNGGNGSGPTNSGRGLGPKGWAVVTAGPTSLSAVSSDSFTSCGFGYSSTSSGRDRRMGYSYGSSRTAATAVMQPVPAVLAAEGSYDFTGGAWNTAVANPPAAMRQDMMLMRERIAELQTRLTAKKAQAAALAAAVTPNTPSAALVAAGVAAAAGATASAVASVAAAGVAQQELPAAAAVVRPIIVAEEAGLDVLGMRSSVGCGSSTASRAHAIAIPAAALAAVAAASPVAAVAAVPEGVTISSSSGSGSSNRRLSGLPWASEVLLESPGLVQGSAAAAAALSNTASFGLQGSAVGLYSNSSIINSCDRLAELEARTAAAVAARKQLSQQAFEAHQALAALTTLRHRPTASTSAAAAATATGSATGTAAAAFAGPASRGSTFYSSSSIAVGSCSSTSMRSTSTTSDNVPSNVSDGSSDGSSGNRELLSQRANTAVQAVAALSDWEQRAAAAQLSLEALEQQAAAALAELEAHQARTAARSKQQQQQGGSLPHWRRLQVQAAAAARSGGSSWRGGYAWPVATAAGDVGVNAVLGSVPDPGAAAFVTGVAAFNAAQQAGHLLHNLHL